MDDIKNNNLVQATEILNIIEDIIAENNGDFSSIINQNLTLKDKLYSKGSTLFLGYFNPCPIEDLIVGKTKRGKIISNKAASNKALSKDTVTYYFEKNIIKMAEDFSSYYLFFYTDVQYVYILGVPKNIQINTLLKFLICKYDENDRICKLTDFYATLMINQGLLFSFMKSDMLLINDKNQNEYLFGITEKEYFYSENHIAKIQIRNYSSNNICRHVQQYEFNYSADRYSSYLFNRKEYKVLHERKFNEFIKKPNFSDYQK